MTAEDVKALPVHWYIQSIAAIWEGFASRSVKSNFLDPFIYRFYLHEGDERKAEVAEKYEQYLK